MLPNQNLFNFNLYSEYEEFFINTRTCELTLHHLKYGFEFILKFRPLNKSIDNPEIDTIREPFNSFLNVDREHPIPLDYQFLMILRDLLHELNSLFYFLQSSFLLKPWANNDFFIDWFWFLFIFVFSNTRLLHTRCLF